MRRFRFDGVASPLRPELAEELLGLLDPGSDPAQRLDLRREPDATWLERGTIAINYRLGGSNRGLRIAEVQEWVEIHSVPGIWGSTLEIAAYGLPGEQRLELRWASRTDRLEIDVHLPDPLFDRALAVLCRAQGWGDPTEAGLIEALQGLSAFRDVPALPRELPLERDHFDEIEPPTALLAALEGLAGEIGPRAGVYHHLQLLLLCAAGQTAEALARIEAHRAAGRKIKDLGTFAGFCRLREGDLARARRELRGQRTHAGYWLRLEALFRAQAWGEYIQLLYTLEAEKYRIRRPLDAHTIGFLQADAYARAGDKARAMQLLKRAMGLNPWSSYNEELLRGDPDPHWVPFPTGRLFEAIREEPGYRELMRNPFRQMHTNYARAVGLLAIIPPFTEDWDFASPFETIDLEPGENTARELGEAYEALKGIYHYPPHGQPHRELRMAVLLAKLQRFEEARGLVRELLQHRPRVKLARALLERLADPPPRTVPKRRPKLPP